jgi:3-deoxy-D-arabino-heptulosonate 7-phosphate (DAHP) synthase class II
MPTEFNFINELMVVMQKGAMTPKVQVERIAGQKPDQRLVILGPT